MDEFVDAPSLPMGKLRAFLWQNSSENGKLADSSCGFPHQRVKCSPPFPSSFLKYNII